MTVVIASAVLAAIRDEAAASPGREVCGLLFGSAERIAGHRSSANVADHPSDSFEIDPADLIAAHRAERAGGSQIVGCYHSHPSGGATPSARDASAADANAWLWLILGGEDVGLYRAVHDGPIHDRFEAVEYRVLPDA